MADKKTSKKNSKGMKPATSRKKPSKQPPQKAAKAENNTARIIWGIVFLLLAACVAVSYFWNEGEVIVYLSGLIKGVVGYGYWALGACFFIIFYILCFSEHRRTAVRIVCSLLFPIFFSGVIHLIVHAGTTTLDIDKYFNSGRLLQSGGVLGSLLGYISYKLLSKVGGIIILFIILIIQLVVILNTDSETFKFERKEKNIGISAESDVLSYAPAKTVSVKDIKVSKTAADTMKPVTASKRGAQTKSIYDVPLGEDEPKLSATSKKGKSSKKTIPVILDESRGTSDELKKEVVKQNTRMKHEELEKVTKEVAEEVASNDSGTKGDYIFPPTSLLDYGKNNGADSSAKINETKTRIETALHSFGIMSYVVNTTSGPTVTRYDIQLEQGVKLNKVINLSGDIALALGVSNVRVAPIPDEISTVGIEVPNKIVNVVSLREVLESDSFQRGKSKLTFAIGKDIGGHAIVGNITKLPHLLIAGTTGSGKSVCMNSLIVSLLYKARPDEVKFIMIDPKMVELGIYNSIPNLYVPVVTDPKKAAGALQWAVVEMLKRYRNFSEAGVRDLEAYNSFCVSNNEKPYPHVVIVVDELADLMMAASKEVEESICRVAQMGRAAGMHLVIATQRPSADVITGLMKANIPSRIAFAVSSAMESRIIMDTSGAEKLVGNGDMLYSPLGSGKPLRIQGCYISDDEREKVIKFISENCSIEKEKNAELEECIDSAGEDKTESSKEDKNSSVCGDYDDVLPDAVEIVLEMKSCSVSMLQRRLKLGYSRAARVVDQMEELGIVGPYEGAKPRSLEVDRDGWNSIKVQLGLACEDDFALADSMNENYSDEGSDNYELP